MRRFVLFADALTAGYKQDRAIEDTMKAFLAIAWSVSGVPGRKSLIWLTGSFPFALDSPNTVPGSGLAELYEHTMQALNNAQVAVYPVDVRGLISNSPIVDPHYSTGARGSEMSAAITPRNFLQDTSVESLQNFADMTGGLAYFNNSDLGAGFKRATDDSSSYYMLSYYGNSNDNKAGWRKLRVEVNRKDAQVRARSGYFVTNATNDPKLTHQADVAFALSSPFDSTGIPVTIQWKGAATDGDKHKIGFALQIPETNVVDEGDQNRFDIEVVVQTSRNGTPVGDTSQTVKRSGTVEAQRGGHSCLSPFLLLRFYNS